MFRHPIRVGVRLLGFLAVSAAALIDYLCRVAGRRGAAPYRLRAEWSQRWARRFLRALGVSTTWIGSRPENGVLVCNHLSYLDIVVLAAATPAIFVSKREVKYWPIIGWLASCGGTLFINRRARADVLVLNQAFAPVIEQGVALVLFPEGTSSDGREVLKFHSALLEPVAQRAWPVSAAWIGYSLTDGSAAKEACYWGDMTFAPHFLNLLSKESIAATVAYSPPPRPGLDRKQLARVLREQVCAMAAIHAERAGPGAVAERPPRATDPLSPGRGNLDALTIRGLPTD